MAERNHCLTKLPFAQDDDTDRRHQHEHADDLKGQIEIGEEQSADVMDVVGFGGSADALAVRGWLAVLLEKQ